MGVENFVHGISLLRQRKSNRDTSAVVALHVCPTVHPQGTTRLHWTDFLEIWYFSTFRNFVEKVQDSLKSDKNNMHFTGGPTYVFDDISLNSS
jgi:hypothetical protein